MYLLKKKKKLLNVFFIGLIFFRASLDILYLTVLNEYYKESYLLSYLYNLDMNGLKVIVSWIAYISIIIYIDKKFIVNKGRGSEIIITGLVVMSFAPATSLYGLANLDNGYFFATISFWIILLATMSLFDGRKDRNSKKKSLSNNGSYYLWICIVVFFCSAIVFISWKYNNLRFNLTLDSVKIYELRSLNRTRELGTIIDYIRNNAMYIVIPFAAVICWTKKKWVYLSILILIQLLLYGIDNQKAALFILPVSIMAHILYKKNMLFYIPIALFFVNVLIYIEYTFTNLDFLTASILERIYYLPAMLGNCYYIFFQDAPSAVPFVTLFEKLGLVSNYPYGSVGVPYQIAERFFYNVAISANTGMIGSAYSYGILGIILVPIAYGILFYFLDKVTSNIEIKSYISITIFLVYAITGATIFVVLTVYGFMLALLLLYLVNDNINFKSKSTLKSGD